MQGVKHLLSAFAISLEFDHPANEARIIRRQNEPAGRETYAELLRTLLHVALVARDVDRILHEGDASLEVLCYSDAKWFCPREAYAAQEGQVWQGEGKIRKQRTRK